MIVVDTSALGAALVSWPPDRALHERLAGEAELHAPHLVDVEFLHVLRRLTQTDALGADRAEDARTDFTELNLIRYPHEHLLDRMWELRHNLTAYDACFVALSEVLGSPLVTADARLRDAPGHDAVVEVYAGR